MERRAKETKKRRWKEPGERRKSFSVLFIKRESIIKGNWEATTARGMEGLGWEPNQTKFLQKPLHFHTLHADLGYVLSAHDLLEHQKSHFCFRKPEGKEPDPVCRSP